MAVAAEVEALQQREKELTRRMARAKQRGVVEMALVWGLGKNCCSPCRRLCMVLAGACVACAFILMSEPHTLLGVEFAELLVSAVLLGGYGSDCGRSCVIDACIDSKNSHAVAQQRPNILTSDGPEHRHVLSLLHAHSGTAGSCGKETLMRVTGSFIAMFAGTITANDDTFAAVQRCNMRCRKVSIARGP